MKMDLSQSVLTITYFITYVDIGRNIFALRKPLVMDEIKNQSLR